jgi:hypothetical protein
MYHGRLGQQLKVYWPAEHMRVDGVIDDHDQVDDNSHMYHIVYQDGNEQVASSFFSLIPSEFRVLLHV